MPVKKKVLNQLDFYCAETYKEIDYVSELHYSKTTLE